MRGSTELEQKLGRIDAQEARIDEEKTQLSREVREKLTEIDEKITELQSELSSLYDLRQNFEEFLSEASPHPGSNGVRRTRRIVLDFLRRHPDSTATQISRDTRLNEPTVQAQLVRAMKDSQVTRSEIRPFRYKLIRLEECPESGGLSPPDASKRNKRITLHEEIRDIFLESDEEWLTTRQLSGLVNKRGRYRKKDGSDVTAYQIHGRIKNYARLFERQKQNVRLLVR